MVKVKICGITNLQDAAAAVNAGADAIGFVFYRKSPRFIDPARAARISKALPSFVAKVGVFVDENPRIIRQIFSKCGLTMIQLQGSESPKDTSAIGLPAIKAFRVNSRQDVCRARKYRGCAYLFEGFDPGVPGGAGARFNWHFLAETALTAPCFLAGGLNEHNVAAAIRSARPYFVDVSSGVENVPGKKDRRKIMNFIRRAKGKQ